MTELLPGDRLREKLAREVLVQLREGHRHIEIFQAEVTEPGTCELVAMFALPAGENFDSLAMLVAVCRETGHIFTGPCDLPGDIEQEPGGGFDPDGPSTGGVRTLNVVELLNLPPKRFTYVVRVVLRDLCSNTIQAEIRPLETGFVDPAIADFLIARRDGLPPRRLQPGPPLSCVPRFAVVEEALLEEEERQESREPFLHVTTPRLTRLKTSCVVVVSYRLPIWRRDLVRTRHRALFQAGPTPPATVPISLLVAAADVAAIQQIDLVVPAQRLEVLPSPGLLGAVGIVAGSFSIDLFERDETWPFAQTVFVYAIARQILSAPATSTWFELET